MAFALSAPRATNGSTSRSEPTRRDFASCGRFATRPRAFHHPGTRQEPSLFVQDDNLENPNGLYVEQGRILVASWGRMADDFSTKVPGHVKVVDLKTKAVSDLGDPAVVGNLDGIAPDGAGGYHVTDWVKGGLFHVTKDGKAVRVAPLNPHSADLCAGPEGSVIIPMMAEGTVLALKVK